ncbi:guanylin-like [Pleurodeles waltl]|uniref:guanylin-like n=1 Tax=Pleurodeles waltl TaxID=8319 RepID=UPI003709C028
MKALVTTAAIILLLANMCRGVTVQVGGLSFPLDEVKELKNLLNSSLRMSPRSHAAWCHSLPGKFKAACVSNPGDTYAVLTQVARHPDKCEICAYAACFGCGSII